MSRPGDHRNTPRDLWHLALRALDPDMGSCFTGTERFDLDPCSNPTSTVPANAHAMGPKVDRCDGLALEWHGHVFVNPPFSMLKTWVVKSVSEHLKPEVSSVQLVTTSDVGTSWSRLLRDHDALLGEPPGRFHFPLPDAPNKKAQPNGTALLWLLSTSDRVRARWGSTLIQEGWTVSRRLV